ncbi:MAG: GNAT family N-acetyltransferase [Taibaiella sp.]|nr:GNAT family N-acetyltransferase [Taibaiella sp.]
MNLKLRPWQPNDLDSLVKNADNFNIARFMTDKFPYPYTREHGEAFLQMASLRDPVNIFAMDVDGLAVGGIGIFPQDDIMRKNAELGYWLGEAHWGRGITTRAIEEMTAYAFRTFDIARIYARPFGANLASQKVLEKNGFKLEATIPQAIFKNGSYDDELIYAIRR